MKRRRDMTAGVNDDGLQADVMRFMAIIAFCLVAIMALARNAVPLDAETMAVEAPTARMRDAAMMELEMIEAEEEARVDEAVPAPIPGNRAAAVVSTLREANPAFDPAPRETPTAEADVSLAASMPPRASRNSAVSDAPGRAEVIVAAREATARPGGASSSHMGDSNVMPEPVVAPGSEPTDQRPTEARRESPPARAPEEDVGLSLRFASERDFLRLVGRDAIEVFAFREGDILALTSSLRFASSAAPGQVYELMPSTIPSEIAGRLADVRTDFDQFQWGVRMPGRIERAVRAQVDAGVAGVLVIDRFGEVRLLAHPESSR